MRKFAKMAIAAAIAGCAMAAQADLLIDNFSKAQARLTDSTADSSGLQSSVQDAGILGGERDLFLTNLAQTNPGFDPADPAQVTARVSGGFLTFSTEEFAIGRAIVRWDGNQSGSAIGSGTAEGAFLGGTNTTGLGGENLKNKGSAFAINVFNSDLGFDFALTVFTDATHFTTLLLESAPHIAGNPGPQPIQFTDFEGPACAAFNFTLDANDLCSAPSGSGAKYFTGVGAADLTNVGALLATINFSGRDVKVDLSINDAKVVPEPSSLALLGLALSGLALVRRRKN